MTRNIFHQELFCSGTHCPSQVIKTEPVRDFKRKLDRSLRGNHSQSCQTCRCVIINNTISGQQLQTMLTKHWHLILWMQSTNNEVTFKCSSYWTHSWSPSSQMGGGNSSKWMEVMALKLFQGLRRWMNSTSFPWMGCPEYGVTVSNKGVISQYYEHKSIPHSDVVDFRNSLSQKD